MTEGALFLSSLREERMEVVAKFCRGYVLDIGCGPGNLFINNYIGHENGIGIDVYPYSGVENIYTDPSKLPFSDNTFDTITLIAVSGHIPKEKRISEFTEFTRILKKNGRLIFTSGEPITQYIVHKWGEFYFSILGQKDMDTERGMDHDEEYCMPHKEILKYLNTKPLQLVRHHRFMWNLNNVFIAEKI
tara:strand:- start:271 stop:837 length:567 start_codon:yes stop_codon:yes gene_type:complete